MDTTAPDQPPVQSLGNNISSQTSDQPLDDSGSTTQISRQENTNFTTPTTQQNIPEPVTTTSIPPTGGTTGGSAPSGNIPEPVTTASIPPSGGKKFPFMFITVLLILMIVGFTGSFLFFQKSVTNNTSTPATPKITPPVTLKPSPTLYANPFASPSAAFQNPFASPSAAYQNPFGSYQNPFAVATQSANTQNTPYQNPFNKL